MQIGAEVFRCWESRFTPHAYHQVAFLRGCNRSLGASFAHIENSTYLGPRKPVSAQLSHTDSINLDARPSELLTLGACIPQTCPYPFLDQRPFKLSHGADDLKH